MRPEIELDTNGVYLVRLLSYTNVHKGRQYPAWVAFNAQQHLVGRKQDSRRYVLGRWTELYGWDDDKQKLYELGAAPSIRDVYELQKKLRELREAAG